MRWRIRVAAIGALAVGLAGAARADDAALAKLIARTDAVAKEVAAVRGLPLKHAVGKDVVDSVELRARLAKLAGEHKAAAELAGDGLALGRWGMIPRGTDYAKLMLDVMTEQIAGYYDPETRKLTISKSAGDNAAWAEMVLAHELDHALQDQSFNLHKFEDVGATEGDAALARRALVEGDGIAVMLEVMLRRQHQPVPWSDPMVADTIEKAMSLPGATGSGAELLDRAPLAVRETMMFPYRAGLGFVAALRRHQPWSAVDAAFAKPPRSSEQILHPERYLAGDEPSAITATVPAALHGFAIAHSTVWGELGFDLFLRSHGVDEARAAQAAEGWGGDRAIVMTKDGDVDPTHAVGLVRADWDSEADAIEAEEAAGLAIDDAVVGAVIERTPTRMRWAAADGTSAWVERKGPAVVIAIGVPLWAEAAMITQVWSATAARGHASK